MMNMAQCQNSLKQHVYYIIYPYTLFIVVAISTIPQNMSRLL